MKGTINGVELPCAWAIRTPAPDRDVRVHLTRLHPAISFESYCYPADNDDGHCLKCSYIVCACAPKAERSHAPAALPPSAGLPENWVEYAPERDANSDVPHHYNHVSGAKAWLIRSTNMWRWAQTKRALWQGECATRAEAMAAALGFTILGTDGGGYGYDRADTAGRVQRMQRTRDAAALAALQFDADQRRQKPVEHAPGEIPPGWKHAPDAYAERRYRYVAGSTYVCVKLYDDGRGGGEWRAFHPGGPSGAGSMHEIMRLARGLNSIAELWS